MKCRYTYQPDIECNPTNMPMTRRTAIAAIATLPVLETQAATTRPLIAGFGERFETQPVSGHGLARPVG
jgi:hypothetical protein